MRAVGGVAASSVPNQPLQPTGAVFALLRFFPSWPRRLSGVVRLLFGGVAMEMVAVSEPYPHLRRRLVFIRLRQWVRSACDFTGLGPSVAARLCCLLVFAAVLFGSVLVLSFLMGFSPGGAAALALAVFLLVLFSGSALAFLGSDEGIASDRERLLRKMPQAKAAWKAYKIKLRAEQERLRAERVAEQKKLLKAKEDRCQAIFGHFIAVAELAGSRTYEIEVVGTSHYQRALEAVCGGRSEESARVKTKAVLVLDDNNPYDSKAVRVEINRQVVGHLSRENARQYRMKLKESGHPNITASCNALIVGGWDRGNGDRGYFGVRLDLPTVEE